MSPRAKSSAPARMGRPPLVAGEIKGRTFSVRLSLAEREEVEQAAIRAGASSASEWARAAILAAARAAAPTATCRTMAPKIAPPSGR